MAATTATPLTHIQGGPIGPIDCISEGWGLIADRYAQALGLIGCFVGAMMIPYGQIILIGPASCGVYYVLFKWLRGEEATVGGFFQGFEWMWQSFLATVLKQVAISIVVIPISLVITVVGLLLVAGAAASGDAIIIVGSLVVAAVLTFVLTLLSLAIGILLVFIYPLITERGLGPWEAIVWSCKGVAAHWLPLLGLFAINIVIIYIGFSMCFVPGILYLPISMASYAVAFSKVYGLADRPSYREFEERDVVDEQGRRQPRVQGAWTPLSAGGEAPVPVEPGGVPSPPEEAGAAEPGAQDADSGEVAGTGDGPDRPATVRMPAQGTGFGSGAGPGDPLPPPPRSATIVESREQLPSAGSPAVESPEEAAEREIEEVLRPRTVVVPPGELPDSEPPTEQVSAVQPPATTPAPTLEPVPEPAAAPVSEPAAEPAAGTTPEPAPDRPMTLEELGAAQTRLMDTNPLLNGDEEGS